MRTAVVDLDGVLAEERPTFERCLAAPMPGAAEGLRRLVCAGYMIVIHTARGWAEYQMTEDWLIRHAMPFDVLICGKPQADIVIDDRAVAFRSWEDINV